MIFPDSINQFWNMQQGLRELGCGERDGGVHRLCSSGFAPALCPSLRHICWRSTILLLMFSSESLFPTSDAQAFQVVGPI